MDNNVQTVWSQLLRSTFTFLSIIIKKFIFMRRMHFGYHDVYYNLIFILNSPMSPSIYFTCTLLFYIYNIFIDSLLFEPKNYKFWYLFHTRYSKNDLWVHKHKCLYISAHKIRTKMVSHVNSYFWFSCWLPDFFSVSVVCEVPHCVYESPSNKKNAA